MLLKVADPGLQLCTSLWAALTERRGDIWKKEGRAHMCTSCLGWTPAHILCMHVDAVAAVCPSRHHHGTMAQSRALGLHLADGNNI